MQVLAASMLGMTARSDDRTNLFASIEHTGEDICFTLPSSGSRWMIAGTIDNSSIMEYGQRICLTNNESIELVDRHIYNAIKAIINSERTGLFVMTRIDYRSFGGGVTQDTWFAESKLKQ